MSILKRFAVPAVIAALVVAAAITMFSGGDQKTLVAHFPRTISIYKGSDVRILGVPVGKVTEVTPSGTDVVVTMSYPASTKIPADAKAVIIAPSIVGDRFIQLTPTYEEGDKVMADGAVLDTDRTAVPLELDQIYASIDQLTVALGPTGANKDGALSDLLETTAKNFGGEGAQFHRTIENFSKLSATLDDNKDELFGSARQLEGFINTLAKNDKTVRSFNQSLGSVSSELAGERSELKASLKNLATAMGEVSTFVKDNKEILGKNISGLNRVSKVLVHQRGALDEILKAAPLALDNLVLTYNPQTGTLDTRANIGQLGQQISADPAAFLCSLVDQADTSGSTCNVIQQALPRTGAFGEARAGKQPDRFDPSLGGLVEVQR